MAVQTLEVNRLRSTLAQMEVRRQLLETNDDAPFVIFLTERLLADIEACKKSCQELKKRAAWPSIN